jgi:hydrogenase 3 maturation protease
VSVDLRDLVHSPGYKLFVGVGNVLKSDDGIGVYIAERIRGSDKIRSLVTGVSIENYIGKINSIPHDTLILVDALDFRKKPGYYGILLPDEIMDYIPATHNISISKLQDFFSSPVLILGIQPQTVAFGEKISDRVQKQADAILKIINSA